MHIIVPMSGEGLRFKNAGYSTIKPLIEVDGNPIVAHVLANFPGARKFTFICNRTHLETTGLADVLRGICPQGSIRPIAPHKKGPVHAVRQAYDLIDDAEPVIVNYCDFGWEWDYEAFRAEVTSEGVDGCIPAYRGFHPHSLGPNLYAFMRTDGNRVLEIREKHNFTPDKMQEYASSGTYYFRSGAVLKKYFDIAVERDISVNGEFYVSSVYQQMIENGLRVSVHPLRRFLQWGTPEDLEEYVKWSEAFRRKATPAAEPVDRPVPVAGVVLAAGAGKRFSDAGYSIPKPFIPISGRPMVEQVIRSLPPLDRLIAVTREEDQNEPHGWMKCLKAACPGIDIVTVPGLTEGQAITAKVGVGRLPRETPVLVASCDTGLVFNHDTFRALASDPSVDAIVFTFRRHLPSIWKPASYGWVETENVKVKRVSVKAPLGDNIKNDHGVTGTFFFKSAGLYLDAVDRLVAADRRVNGEFYIDELINVLIEDGSDVRVLEMDFYLVWGTPEEVKTYQYWQQYFHLNPDHPYDMDLDPDFPETLKEGGTR